MLAGSRFQQPIIEDHARFEAAAAARRVNRRRLVVFLIVFVVTLLPGLAWNFMRPAEYRAAARIQLTAGTVAPRNDVVVPGASAAEQPKPRMDLLTQVQYLTSRSLFEEVTRRLEKEGLAASFAGADPLTTLQGAVSAVPLAGADVVEVQAVGASPQLMAKIVNTLVETYREQLFVSHGSESQETIANLRQEVDRLGASVAEKRAQLSAFRMQSGVVSSERGENEALSRMKGLSDSLNKANEDAAKADAKLRALRDSAASGKGQVLAKDNPTVASLEQRVSATREQLRDMERTYTSDFMAMDPNARALRARLAELEQQLTNTRSNSRQAALAMAEEEAMSAHATVDRLRGQIEGQRREAQVFSGKFNEARAMEDDLARLEGARRNASERLAKLEASESARQPTFKLIETAAVPDKPWRPDYWRDGLINLVASFLLGLVAVWFVELFNRAPQAVPVPSTTVVVPQPWIGPALGVDPSARPELALEGGARTLLQAPAAPPLPRELSQDEVESLLVGAGEEGRLLCGFLLLGLTVEEARDLACADIDLTGARLNLRGPAARQLPLPDWMREALGTYAGRLGDGPLFRDGAGAPLGEHEIRGRLTCAALDAGLDEAASVGPEVLRHTFIAHLVRQQVRFSDLGSLAGPLGAQELSAYAAVSSGPRHVRGDEADPLMPALRNYLPA